MEVTTDIQEQVDSSRYESGPTNTNHYNQPLQMDHKRMLLYTYNVHPHDHD